MNTMSQHIPASAGSSRLVRENITVRRRQGRVARILFTTHDGFVGEATVRNGMFRETTRTAYEAAVAERASALFKAGQVAANVLPRSSYERVNKPAPAAIVAFVPHPEKLSDSALFSEVEARGYEVCFA